MATPLPWHLLRHAFLVRMHPMRPPALPGAWLPRLQSGEGEDGGGGGDEQQMQEMEEAMEQAIKDAAQVMRAGLRTTVTSLTRTASH